MARATGWLFNPAADRLHDVPVVPLPRPHVCEQIPGAHGPHLPDPEADVDKKLCVSVTGRNANGATTLECGGQTNQVLSEDPKQLSPATLQGSAYVGDTLVSTIGGGRPPRRTSSAAGCAASADGGSCETSRARRAATYKLTDADLGKRLRVEINADTNGANLPLAIFVYTPLSAVVTPPPPPPADPQPTPHAAGRRADPAADAEPDPAAHAESDPGQGRPGAGRQRGLVQAQAQHARSSSRSTLSEGASLSVGYERKVSGRKVGKTCKAGAKKGKKCTTYKKLATVKVSGVGGSSTVTLPKRKLAAGDYRVVVTPVDAAGNKGAAKTVTFKVLKK